jgi:hypothetical protein
MATFNYDWSKVNVKEIRCDDRYEGENHFRYSLIIPLKVSGEGKGALAVIAKNPSQAVSGESDKTVNNVIELAYRNHYNEVRMLNVFPYYSTDAKGLQDFFGGGVYRAEQAKNLAAIDKLTKGVDTILAYGTWTGGANKPIYDKAISDIVTQIAPKQLFYVDTLAKSESLHIGQPINALMNDKRKYPRHAQRWMPTSVVKQY